MAYINLNNSCPRRDFLVAWRSGKTCCSICCNQNPATYSRNGLQQHYRMMYKSLEFNDITLKDGVSALREFVASETWQNLMTLSEQRCKSVGTALSKIRLVILNIIITADIKNNNLSFTGTWKLRNLRSSRKWGAYGFSLFER